MPLLEPIICLVEVGLNISNVALENRFVEDIPIIHTSNVLDQ